MAGRTWMLQCCSVTVCARESVRVKETHYRRIKQKSCSSFGLVDSPSGYAPPSCIKRGCARRDGLLPRQPEWLLRRDLSEVHFQGNCFCFVALVVCFRVAARQTQMFRAAILLANHLRVWHALPVCWDCVDAFWGLFSLLNLSSASLWLVLCLTGRFWLHDAAAEEKVLRRR